jgi:predicted enzyme related to lactoylglutathione lyase
MPDPARTTAFFEAVMGWEWLDMQSGAGGDFTHGARKVALRREATPCMVPYLSVTDIEVVVKSVGLAGALR